MGVQGELERQLALVPCAAAGKGVLRFITAGSVDDGKSTLIGRLLHDTRAIPDDQLSALAVASRRRGFEEPDLSLLTDGLEAEREQGITIDVAYRYFATARRKFIIADTPGHEQYTRNMVTGASTADAAIILLDVRKGILDQSKRHLFLARLLGIRQVVVAVNKMDLVGYRQEAFESLCDEFGAIAAPLGMPSPRYIPLSALRGDMVVERGGNIGWYRGATLLETLETFDAGDRAPAWPLRFAVQLVSRPGGGSGARAYLGRVSAGMLRPGSEVVVLPSARRTRVREITNWDGPLREAAAGDSVSISLADELDVSRGDMIADAARPPHELRELEARLCWLANEPLVPSRTYLLRHTTRTVRARLLTIASRTDIATLQSVPFDGQVSMNDIVRVTLRVQQPIFADAYSGNRSTGSFILIDEASNRTIAAGMLE